MVILILNNPTNYYFFTQFFFFGKHFFTQLHPREIWEGLRCEKNDAAAQGQGPESGSKPRTRYPPPEFSTCHSPTTLSHAHFSACINIHFFIFTSYNPRSCRATHFITLVISKRKTPKTPTGELSDLRSSQVRPIQPDLHLVSYFPSPILFISFLFRVSTLFLILMIDGAGYVLIGDWTGRVQG